MILSLDSAVDPLGPATVYGNKPSRGARVDAELKLQDEEELKKNKRKDRAGSK